jgi:effector-binding domain-containing protein
VLAFLQNQRKIIQARIDRLGSVARSLEEIIQTERENREMSTNSSFEVGEKQLDELEVATLRWKGRYADTGKAFSRLGKFAGRHIRGKPLNLYYDSEYKEDDADIESCIPVSNVRSSGALSVRRLPPGNCVYVVHKGPYEQIGRAYARVMEYIQKKNYTALSPSREVYLKGPGMIFRGNPKNYLTEIQIPIETPAEAGHESRKS